MTTLERLLAVIVLCIAASMLGWVAFNRGTRGEDELRTARVDVGTVGNACRAYRNEQGHWPPRLAELSPRYLREEPRDPWGHAVRYEAGAAVISAGPDGAFGTRDDVREDLRR